MKERTFARDINLENWLKIKKYKKVPQVLHLNLTRSRIVDPSTSSHRLLARKVSIMINIIIIVFYVQDENPSNKYYSCEVLS